MTERLRLGSGGAPAAVLFFTLLAPTGLVLAGPSDDSDRLVHEAEAALYSGNIETAVSLATQAVGEAEAAADPHRLARARDMLGNALFYSNRYDEAQREFEEALRMSTESGDAFGCAVATKDVGITCKFTGDFDRAIRLLGEAFRMFTAQDRRDEAASALENLGMAHETLGDHERALDLYRQSGRIWQDLGSQDGIRGSLVRMGFLFLAADRPGQASACFEQALALPAGNAVERAWMLGGLSCARAKNGDLDAAIEAREEALALTLRAGSELHAASHCRALAELRRRTEPQRALEDLQLAQDLQQRNAGETAWNGDSEVAWTYAQLGDLDRAIEYSRRGVERLEAVRAGLRTEAQRISVIGNHQMVYQDAIDYLMTRFERRPDGGDDRSAFELLERARAHALAEAVAAGGRPPGHDAPHHESLGQGQVQAFLDDHTALIAYAVTREAVFGFVVSAHDLHAVRLALTPADLTERIRNFVELLERTHGDDAPAFGRRLYRDLVAPLRRHLPGGIRDLIIVPDGAMHCLPFEALPSAPHGSGFLLRDFTISYAPSATVLDELRRRGDGRPEADLLVLANPPFRPREGAPYDSMRARFAEDPEAFSAIPYSVEEARLIARYAGAGSRVLVGKEASEAELKHSGASRFRVVHFATHGIVSQRRAGYAALLLAPGAGEDGLLEANEILGMQIPCDLLVISACQTARGRVLEGEGVQSLARAFFYAGARSVVASLWKVEDRATATLMDAFYGHLAGGESAMTALRSAKLDLLRSGEAVSPRDWAAFVILGDASRPIEIRGLPGWQRHGWWLVLGGLLTAVALLTELSKAGDH